ncbi:MAG: bacillithiol biosynthesis cysteine-adding enzyme BshC [Terriglobales bacterium]
MSLCKIEPEVTALVQPECLPYTAIPHTTRLFAEYSAHADALREYYPSLSLLKDWAAASHLLRYDAGRRERVAGILERQNREWNASPATLESIARFRAGASVMVTGQQVALFGGPLFSLYKALTAIKLAAEATKSGTDCVPVFWLATEDHDLAEVNHVTLLDDGGRLHELSTPSQSAADAPVGTVRLGAEIEGVVQAAAQALGSAEAEQFLRQSYRPGETLGSAFGRLFSLLFRDSGIVLLDASDPELHRIAEPVYRGAALAAADLTSDLLRRSKALEAAGYHAQVKVTPSSTLLFQIQNSARSPIHRVNGGFQAGKEKLTAEALAARIVSQPEQFSANVLLRPVVQDYLLPTLAYVGGPAEVAYFAQASVVYEELLGRVTPVAPRLSATLIEPRVKRLLDRYRLAVPDAFHTAEQLRETLAHHSLPTGLDAEFNSAAASLGQSLDAVTAALAGFDPTLATAAGKARSKMSYQLERLRGRAARAQMRRNQLLARHAEEISASLYPHKDLQERSIGGISFLARYGTGLLLRLFDSAALDCPGHQIIHL